VTTTKIDIDTDKLIGAVKALALIARGQANALKKMLPSSTTDEHLDWTNRRVAEMLATLGEED
jgi:hypothetical protein